MTFDPAFSMLHRNLARFEILWLGRAHTRRRRPSLSPKEKVLVLASAPRLTPVHWAMATPTIGQYPGCPRKIDVGLTSSIAVTATSSEQTEFELWKAIFQGLPRTNCRRLRRCRQP